MKKIFTALCCCAALAACTQLPAQEPPYLLQTRGGELAYYDAQSAQWHPTGCREEALSNEADRAALRCGLPLYSREALTRALEDFCS